MICPSGMGYSESSGYVKPNSNLKLLVNNNVCHACLCFTLLVLQLEWECMCSRSTEYKRKIKERMVRAKGPRGQESSRLTIENGRRAEAI